MVLTLYKLDLSPPARSVMMVIEAANIPDVKHIDVNILELDQLKEEYQKLNPQHTKNTSVSNILFFTSEDKRACDFRDRDEIIALNPQHTIPMLKDDDFVVWDSHAISVYLLTKYSNNETLYPTDPKKRAIIDQRLHFDSGILFPCARGAFEPIVFRGEKSFKPEILQKIRTAYEFCEKFLTEPWMAGNEFTLADICCVTSISSLNLILPIDENLYPNITAWLKRCKELDFYKTKNEPGLLALEHVLRSKLK